MKSVCIMGGGLGGLMTGALLAKEGYRVSVLEKNRIIGGGLQSFRRGDYLFDTGMHIFGGMGDDGQMRRICRYLGIEERVKVQELKVEQGLWDAGNEEYYEAMRSLTETEPLYTLRPTEADYRMPDMGLTAMDFIGRFAHDDEEKKRLARPAMLYGGQSDSPALLHALIACAHRNGAYTFVGGSLHFAELLAEVIVSAGGEVHCGEAVTGIDVAGRNVCAVHTEKGSYTADIYINDMPVSRLLELMPKGAFTRAFRSRIGSAPYTISAMNLFLGLKPHSMNNEGRAYFVTTEDCDLWNIDKCSEEQWPQAMYAQPAENTITAILPMKYEYVERWADSQTGRRPQEYYNWKNMMMDRAINMVCQELGIPRDAIAYAEAGTPLTIRDYYDTPRGALYGIHRSTCDPLQSSLSTRTRLTNLYLTGQDVNFHGLIGTSLTAILTAETIVGRNTIVNKINDTIWKQ